MDAQKFLQLSACIARLWLVCKNLTTTHAFRYLGIVSHSARGIECPYAQQSLRYHVEEPQVLREMLLAIREHVNTCLEILDE